MSRVSDLIVRIGADISGFQRELRSMQRQMTTAGRAMEDIGSRLAMAVSAPILGVGAAALKAAGDMEAAKIGFTTLLGSAEKAGAYLQELAEFAKRTPFELPEVIECARVIKGMQFAIGDVIPMLTSLGNGMSAMGLGSDRMKSAIVQLGQMNAKAKVNAQDMRTLADTGIPVWDVLAKAAGKGVGQMMKLSEQGMLDGKLAVKVILEGMQQMYGGAMENMSKSFHGLVSNVKDNILLTLAEVGATLLPFAKNAASGMLPILESIKSLAKQFAALPKPAQYAAAGLAGIAAAAPLAIWALGTLVTNAGVLIGAFGRLVPWIARTATALHGLTAAQVAQSFSNIAFAVRNGLIPALSGAEKAALALGVAMAAASAAAAAYSIYEHFQENRRALDEQAAAQQGLEASTKRLETAARAKGITIDRGRMSLEQYSIALSRAMRSATDAAVASGQLKVAKTDVQQASQHAATAAQQFAASIAEATGKVEKKTAKAHELKSALDVASEAVRRHHDEVRKWQELAGITAETIEAMRVPIDATTLGLQYSTQAVRDHLMALQALRDVGLPTFDLLNNESSKYFQTLNKLGVKSSAQAREDLQAAEDALDHLNQRSANGQDDPMERRGINEQIERLKRELGDLPPKAEAAAERSGSAMQRMGRQVSTVMTDLSRGISEAITDGGKLGDTFEKVGLQAAKALQRWVIEEGLRKIGKEILSLMDGMGGLAKRIAGLFGGAGASASGVIMNAAGSGAGAATSIAGAGGQAGSGAAGLAMQGAMGWVGAIGSAASAVFEGLQYFQQRRMEKDIGRMEVTSRGILNQLIHLQTSANTYWPTLHTIADRLRELVDAQRGGSGGGGVWRIEMVPRLDDRFVDELVTKLKQRGVRVQIA